jgi:uncharacterized OB-fold protein
VSAGLSVSRCGRCGWRGLPQRLWCPVCGADTVSRALVHGGTVAETTVLRRALGGLAAPVRIGLVALAGGGTAVVRLEPDAGSGSRVILATEDGAPVARPMPRTAAPPPGRELPPEQAQ